MKGTVFDLLKLAAQKPEVARDLAELAAKHGIEFSDEVSDDELEQVAGGADIGSLEGQVTTQGEDLQMTQMEVQQSQEQLSQAYQTYSSILKSWNETSKSIINNLRA